MTFEDIEDFIRSLGHTVETLTDSSNVRYTHVREFEIPSGTLRGRVCDIAIQQVLATPYVPPSGIHTCPTFLGRDSSPIPATQVSPLGGEWQYWSRRYDHVPTPRSFWTHVQTILCEV